MDNQELVAEWQARIAGRCEAKLGRQLSLTERQSIGRFGGFQALEMIEDTVDQARPDEVEQYLRMLAG
jgi:hypothetical protein